VGLLVGAINYGAALLVGVISATIVRAVISTLLTTVLFPFFGIAETLLYYDARIRKEGFDVEHLAAALDDGGVSTATA
jgi:hypothetical protein